jgi:Phosphotransferase enzyme family
MTLMKAPPALVPEADTLRQVIATGPSPVVAARLLPGVEIAGLTVERVHFPAARAVQVQVRAIGREGLDRVLICEWLGADAERHAATEAARLAKPRRGQASGDGDPVVLADPARGLVLRRPGHDAKLPGLRLLHDPGWAAGELARLGRDPGATITLVAHRLAKRAVLRISGADGTVFARLRPVTSGSGAAAFAQHQALWVGLDEALALTIPRPLVFDDGLGLALFDALPGAGPVFQGLPGFAAVHAVTRALAALQALPVGAPLHSVEDEIGILDGWAARTAAVFPELAARLAGPLARLRDGLSGLFEPDPVLCHRDLHEGQILLAAGRAGLLDFDTLRRGDPGLDAGNLQAHLVLAGLRDGRSRRAFVTAIEVGLPHLSLRRIGLWRRAALLRLAMLHAFSATPREVIDGLIREAE